MTEAHTSQVPVIEVLNDETFIDEKLTPIRRDGRVSEPCSPKQNDGKSSSPPLEQSQPATDVNVVASPIKAIRQSVTELLLRSKSPPRKRTAPDEPTLDSRESSKSPRISMTQKSPPG